MSDNVAYIQVSKAGFVEYYSSVPFENGLKVQVDNWEEFIEEPSLFRYSNGELVKDDVLFKEFLKFKSQQESLPSEQERLEMLEETLLLLMLE